MATQIQRTFSVRNSSIHGIKFHKHFCPLPDSMNPSPQANYLTIGRHIPTFHASRKFFGVSTEVRVVSCAVAQLLIVEIFTAHYRRVRKIVKSDYSLPHVRLSVCLFVRPAAWNNPSPTWRIYIKFGIWFHIENPTTKLNTDRPTDVTCFIISLFTAQHVSNVSTSIFRSNTWNTSTISRKLLKMDVLIFETCWAVNIEIIKQVTSSWSIFIQLSRWCTVQ